MKRILKIAAIASLGFAIGWTIGCKPSANPPTAPQLAPGYNNAADQQMGEILSGAHAFYTSIQQQAQAGTLTLQPSVKAAFNAFGVSLNAAQTVYLSYHQGTATQSQAQTAVDKVQSEQAALPLPGAK
jgi:hypothetical protein